ncbi:hypothetical protein MKW98_029175 [Papaver atlanticum]|uniref:At3g05675-like ankyrin-like domain-containing protein n=1 Tax=Papaver atlanticum TaxID=357466 RepID=A0AAD4SZY8_9MAGN|nr:hypothetical protein MKW98_029175 [Papaver atlanticum]
MQVLGLLGFQPCIHTCLEYLGAAQWVGKNVNITSDPSIDTFVHMMEVVIKSEENDGRRAAKSLVLKILSENNIVFSSPETCDKNILSLCRTCSNSLLNLFIKAEIYYKINQHVDKDVDRQIYLEGENLLWLLDLLADRQAAEKFALMWANQQKLANLHKKFCSPSRHLVSCITTRLLAGCIGNRKILLTKDIRQMLLRTWFQPLVDDYSRLRRLDSFDAKAVEENIERAIVELTPEGQQTGSDLTTDLWEQQRTSSIQECIIKIKLILRIYFKKLVDFGREKYIAITLTVFLMLCMKVLFFF